MSRVLEAELPKRWGLVQRWKNTLIYVFVRLAAWTVRVLPFSVARNAGRLLGRLAPYVAVRDRHRAEDNLAKAFPELTTGDHRRISKEMFLHLGTCAAEMVHIERFINGAEKVELTNENRAVLDAALAAGKGSVIVSGHMGNWELLAQLIAAAGYSITGVAKPLYDPRLTRWVHRHRSAFGHNIVWRGDDGVARELFRALKKNGFLGLLIDQDTKVQGAFVPFFNRPAHTPSAPASLALKTGASIVGARIWREGRDHRMFFELIEPPSGDDLEQRIEALTATLSLWLENAIREYPEQWVWLHDRWRRQPDSTDLRALDLNTKTRA
ncbi:MAG: hypothetical protein A2289_11535 [Deltaproteobacteria bacterium RIFOXYA12_FULL_58_15]|nr:MAG: hypothetical protein A2289_11535 [Deltaproteobacteria bacterium RIFOXYA12_FULL_58_15]OGR08338.1 MAG: hypothetical protein A2341_25040 [Deltaproteobacteria bacterium RIFOXYB12_FULL_58_9]